MTDKAPLLLDWKVWHLWGNSYRSYYGQDTGKLFSFQPFNCNLQLGAGRNSVTLVLLNFGVIVSWNARRTHFPKAEEIVQSAGPQLKMKCFFPKPDGSQCGADATSVTPICEAHLAELMPSPPPPPAA
jgi:hypothetical protein